MSSKTEVNLILVAPDKPRSGVSTRLVQEVLRLLSTNTQSSILAICPFRVGKSKETSSFEPRYALVEMVETVGLLSRYNMTICRHASWAHTSPGGPLHKNLETVVAAVKRVPADTSDHEDNSTYVFVDSDGVFDSSEALHGLVKALEDVEVQNDKLNLIVGVHMSAADLQEFSANYPIDKPLFLTLPRDHYKACRLWSNLIEDETIPTTHTDTF